MMVKLDFLLSLIFPEECLGCGREGNWLCQSCYLKLNIKPRILTDILELDQAIVLSEYQKPLLKRAIHLFKYSLAHEVGKEIVEKFLCRLNPNDGLWQEIDFIVPVPLHPKRKLWRGFNQSEIIACSLGRLIDKPALNKALRRTKNSRQQVGLSGDDRQINVNGIFKASAPVDFNGKCVMLVDDVITSGSTISECAKACRQAGAAKVYALALAHG